MKDLKTAVTEFEKYSRAVNEFNSLDELNNLEKANSIYWHMAETISASNKEIKRPVPEHIEQINYFINELHQLVSEKNKLGFSKDDIQDGKEKEIQSKIDALLDSNKQTIDYINKNIENKNNHIISNIESTIKTSRANSKSAVYTFAYLLNENNITNFIGTALIDNTKLKEVNLVVDQNKKIHIYDVFSGIRAKRANINNFEKMNINYFLLENGDKVDFLKFEKLNTSELKNPSFKINTDELFETVSEKTFSNIIENLSGFEFVESEEKMGM